MDGCKGYDVSASSNLGATSASMSSSCSGLKSSPSTPLPRLCTTPSRRRSLASNSESGGFLLRLGARPGRGNMHSIPALLQLEHGCFLSHLTFLFLHVVHDLGFMLAVGATTLVGEVGDLLLGKVSDLGAELWSIGKPCTPRSGEAKACGVCANKAAY